MTNNAYEKDKYRLYGTEHGSLLKDFRLRYMFCWRKIRSHSRFTFFYKIVLKGLRKHYHIEIPYTVCIGDAFSMDHAYNITINSKAVLGNNVSIYKGATI